MRKAEKYCGRFMKKKKTKKRAANFSKRMTRLAMLSGLLIAQECLLLIAYAIHREFMAAAAYLTAAVGLAEGIIAASLNFYISMAKKEHTEGGITFEASKAKGFIETEDEYVGP